MVYNIKGFKGEGVLIVKLIMNVGGGEDIVWVCFCKGNGDEIFLSVGLEQLGFFFGDEFFDLFGDFFNCLSFEQLFLIVFQLMMFLLLLVSLFFVLRVFWCEEF